MERHGTHTLDANDGQSVAVESRTLRTKGVMPTPAVAMTSFADLIAQKSGGIQRGSDCQQLAIQMSQGSSQPMNQTPPSGGASALIWHYGVNRASIPNASLANDLLAFGDDGRSELITDKYGGETSFSGAGEGAPHLFTCHLCTMLMTSSLPDVRT